MWAEWPQEFPESWAPKSLIRHVHVHTKGVLSCLPDYNQRCCASLKCDLESEGGEWRRGMPHSHQKTALTRALDMASHWVHTSRRANSNMVSLTYIPCAKVRGHRIKAKSTRHTGIPSLWVTPAAIAIHTIGHHFQRETPTSKNISSSRNMWIKCFSGVMAVL